MVIAVVAMVVATALAPAGAKEPQQQVCDHVAQLVAIAEASSVEEVQAASARSPQGYETALVQATRAAALQPRNVQLASQLIGQLPQTEEQRQIWLNLGSDCPGPRSKNAFALAKISTSLPLLSATASLVSKRDMPTYFRFAIGLEGYVDNDVPEKMQRVCRADPVTFRRAFEQLRPEEQQQFNASVVDVSSCKARVLPEAD